MIYLLKSKFTTKSFENDLPFTFQIMYLMLSFHSCIQSSTAVERGTDPRYGYTKGYTFVICFIPLGTSAGIRTYEALC